MGKVTKIGRDQISRESTWTEGSEPKDEVKILRDGRVLDWERLTSHHYSGENTKLVVGRWVEKRSRHKYKYKYKHKYKYKFRANTSQGSPRVPNEPIHAMQLSLTTNWKNLNF